MDRESLPRWAWLLLGLLVAAAASSTINWLLDVALEWRVVTTIAFMSPVLVYVGVWYDEDRRSYWEHSRARIVGDALFVVVASALGAGIALALVLDTGLNQLLRDVVAMIVGFTLGWGLFWWRNPELYREE
ncbi:hypothetical protein [Salinilacihabitans rarus]|uniref:hypothetical protein n=1 Tax=Salinilacihabitans rarus TaxID=2961596 RepID=UPI0020C84B1B|nr:hypothetical protein [Salinilacihabitans rarus]